MGIKDNIKKKIKKQGHVLFPAFIKSKSSKKKGGKRK
jgi:hypothetical protein